MRLEELGIKGTDKRDVIWGRGCSVCNDRGYTVSTYRDEVRDEETYWTCHYCLTTEQRQGLREKRVLLEGAEELVKLDQERQSAQRRIYLAVLEEEEANRQASFARERWRAALAEVQALDSRIEDLRGLL